MSEKCRKKCPKNVQKLSGRAESTIFGRFSDIFFWSMLLFGDPVQRSPVTRERKKHIKKTHIKIFGGSQGGGAGGGVSRPEFFMLASFFPSKNTAHKEL